MSCDTHCQFFFEIGRGLGDKVLNETQLQSRVNLQLSLFCFIPVKSAKASASTIKKLQVVYFFGEIRYKNIGQNIGPCQENPPWKMFFDANERQNMAKITMRFFTALAVLGTVAILVWAGLNARSWNPALSHDTYVYYYNEMGKLNSSEQHNIITDPFKVPLGTTEPDAAQAKPVFVALLNLWHTGYKWLDSSLVFPDNQVYSNFIFATFVLAFLSLVWLGWMLGHPMPGLLAALVALVNVWALTAVYFSSYTAISIFFLSIAFGLIYKKKPAALITAGALMAADVLINQSVTVFMVSYAGLTLFIPNTLRQRLYSLMYYICGIALAWGAFESIILVENIKAHWLYMPQYKVLLAYLTRSKTELSTYFTVYDHSLFPLIIWKFSHVFSAVFIVSMVVAFVILGRKGRTFWGRPEAALLFIVFLTLMLIDWRTGPKFSRTYFLVFPFAVMFTTISCYELWQRGETVRRLLIAAVLSLYLAECARDLQSQKTAFLAARNKMLASFNDETPTYLLGSDTYAPFFLQLTEDRIAGQPSRMVERVIQDLCDPVIDNRLKTLHVLVGPNIPSVINLAGLFTGTVNLPLNPDIAQHSGTCQDKSWSATLEERIPFFSHYPFLMLEDPHETYRLHKDHTIGWEDYKSGIGRVNLWKVTYEGRPDSP